MHTNLVFYTCGLMFISFYLIGNIVDYQVLDLAFKCGVVGLNVVHRPWATTHVFMTCRKISMLKSKLGDV